MIARHSISNLLRRFRASTDQSLLVRATNNPPPESGCNHEIMPERVGGRYRRHLERFYLAASNRSLSPASDTSEEHAGFSFLWWLIGSDAREARAAFSERSKFRVIGARSRRRYAIRSVTRAPAQRLLLPGFAGPIPVVRSGHSGQQRMTSAYLGSDLYSPTRFLADTRKPTFGGTQAKFSPGHSKFRARDT